MINIYTGLMCSGKTDKLLKEYFKVKDNKNNKVLLVKSNYDREQYFVKSRNGTKAIADISLNRNEVSIISSYINTYKYTHVFIDEVQMFDLDITYLVQNHKDVEFHLAGLERDRFKKTFGYLSLIKKYKGVNIIHSDMLCQKCNKKNADEVFGFINSNDIVVTDNEDKYISVCNNCYDLLKEV